MSEFGEELARLDPRQRELLELLLKHDAAAAPSAGEAALLTSREAALAAIWKDVLGFPRVGVHDDFFELGGDSILSMQVVARARREGFTFGTKELFEQPTIAQLARLADAGVGKTADQLPATGELSLTPIQRWFYSLQLPSRDHWNIEAMIRSATPLDLAGLRSAFQGVVDHHDMLRLRVRARTQHDALTAFVPEREPAQLAEMTVSAEDDPTQVPQVLHTSLSLTDGPLIRLAALCDASGDCCRVALVIHHLACDWVSMRVLLEDLQTAYLQASAGGAVILPPKTTSYRHFAAWLAQRESNVAQREQLSAWHEAIASAAPAPASGKVRAAEGSIRWHESSLSLAMSDRLLREGRKRLNADLHDILLHATAAGLSAIEGRPSIVIDVETHGRDILPPQAGDFSRTVGWFAQFAPVHILHSTPQEATGSLAETVQASQTAKQCALSYMQACFGETDGARTLEPIRTPFGFNYLGQFHGIQGGQAFELLPTAAGGVYAGNGERPHLIAVVAYCHDGIVHMRWGYSSDHYSESQIATGSRATAATLEAMIASMSSRRPTPEDFPDADLDAADLDLLFGPGE